MLSQNTHIFTSLFHRSYSFFLTFTVIQLYFWPYDNFSQIYWFTILLRHFWRSAFHIVRQLDLRYSSSHCIFTLTKKEQMYKRLDALQYRADHFSDLTWRRRSARESIINSTCINIAQLNTISIIHHIAVIIALAQRWRVRTSFPGNARLIPTEFTTCIVTYRLYIIYYN